MKITLQKDHECPQGLFKAGETIEVDEATYDWLMSIYIADRQQNSQFVEEFEKKLAPLKQLGKKK